MPEPKTIEPTCPEARDDILAARCEAREPQHRVLRHVDGCASCRDAMRQLAAASPETLALIVLMRGIAD